MEFLVIIGFYLFIYFAALLILSAVINKIFEKKGKRKPFSF